MPPCRSSGEVQFQTALRQWWNPKCAQRLWSPLRAANGHPEIEEPETPPHHPDRMSGALGRPVDSTSGPCCPCTSLRRFCHSGRSPGLRLWPVWRYLFRGVPARDRRTQPPQRIKAQLPGGSQPLHHQLEHYISKDIFRISAKDNRTHQLPTQQQRVPLVIAIRITFKYWIGREIELCRDWLMPGGSHKIVDVLTDTIRVMARHDAVKGIFAVSIADEGGAVSIAI